jgi:hypothetical protein
MDKAGKTFTGTDEFGTEFKIAFTPSTKITTLDVKILTRTVAEIQEYSPQADIFKKGDDVSVIWEKQGTKRVAVKITILE